MSVRTSGFAVNGGRLAAATALVALATLTGSAPALAATDGILSVLPAAGTDLTALTVVTGAACPAGSNIVANITGPGFPEAGQNIIGNSPTSAYEHTKAGGLRIPISLVLRDIGNLPEEPVRYAGTYRITVICRDRVRMPELGRFTGTLVFNKPRAYQAQNPAMELEAAPQDMSAGGVPQLGGLPGAGASPAPSGAAGAAGASPTPSSSTVPVALAASTGSPWMTWAGLTVLCLGGAGLLVSAISAVRRTSRTARP